MVFLSYYINRLILIFFLLMLSISNASSIAVVNVTQLTYGTDTGYANPAWSPDGTKITYNHILDNNYSLWIMDANGSNAVPLTRIDINNPLHQTSTQWVDSMPRWYSDGSKIIFQRSYYDEGGGYEGSFIYIINADGLNQKRLIGATRNPSISPDGGHIAFDAGGLEGFPIIPEQGFGIYVMNIDGTNIKRLTNDIGDEIMPSWSPDGKKIAFTKGGAIHIMYADGSNVTSTGQGGLYSRWSPDGKRIAFLSERAGDMLRSIKIYHIYVMDIDGSNVTQLTFGDNRREWAFDWPPDGTKIVFDSRIPPSAKSNIYIMTLDFNATMPTPTPTAIPTLTATQTPTVTPTTPAPTQTPVTPGFSLLVALVSLSILVLIRRTRR